MPGLLGRLLEWLGLVKPAVDTIETILGEKARREAVDTVIAKYNEATTDDERKKALDTLYNSLGFK